MQIVNNLEITVEEYNILRQYLTDEQIQSGDYDINYLLFKEKLKREEE